MCVSVCDPTTDVHAGLVRNPQRRKFQRPGLPLDHHSSSRGVPCDRPVHEQTSPSLDSEVSLRSTVQS